MSALLNIWQAIVKESEQAQIQEGEKKGLVKNFLINDVYLRESAFAAKIFATEYKRTNNEKYLQKAILALDALQNIFDTKDIKDGIDEPNWTPRGVRYRKGSIPATILLLYAVEETCRLIDYEFRYNIKSVLEYLELCYLGNGKFYHDKVDKSNKSHQYHVVNTTTMSYFFLQLAKSKGIETEFYKKEIQNIEKAIARSQRSDGFWSYIEPSLLQKMFWKVHRFVPAIGIKVYNKVLGDKSILFGDGLHHAVTPYYFIAGFNKSNQELSFENKNFLLNGWSFIESHFVKQDNNVILFDFSWEPKPRTLRYCNFIDTSTYFYILDLMTYLLKCGLISKEKYSMYQNGLLNYIESNLLQKTIPSISAYQGGEEFLHNIMPRPAESIFDKGFFLSNVIDKEFLH